MENLFLDSAIKQFEYYKLLGEKTFDQLSDEDLCWSPSTESNSVATIVKHLSGNMLSRWTDLLTTDGEKEWRNREEEFAKTLLTRQELMNVWQKGWACLLDTLGSLTENDLGQIIYIRNQGHTAVEAINRQLAHYPYHIGQIVFIGKLIRDKDWVSLSIARGSSASYNTQKFTAPKHREHFTDEYLSDRQKPD